MPAIKAPTASASQKAVMGFITEHKGADGTISGGHLYVALFLLTLASKGAGITIEGSTASIFNSKGLVALAGWDKRGILNKLTDAAGNSLLKLPALKPEQAILWAQGKPAASAQPLYIKSKVDRKAIAAGKLPA